MNRRAMLGVIGVVLGAGCIGDDGVPREAGTPTPTATPPPEPTTVVQTSIQTVTIECIGHPGEVDRDTTISVSDGQIIVSGELLVPDRCHEGEIVEVDYLADTDRMAISIGVVDESDDGECLRCLAKLRYTALVEFDGQPPDTIEVQHQSRPEDITEF